MFTLYGYQTEVMSSTWNGYDNIFCFAVIVSHCRLVCILSATVSHHRDHCSLRIRQTPKNWNIFNCHALVWVFGDIVRYNLRQPSLRNSSCNVFVSTYYYTYILDMNYEARATVHLQCYHLIDLTISSANY